MKIKFLFILCGLPLALMAKVCNGAEKPQQQTTSFAPATDYAARNRTKTSYYAKNKQKKKQKNKQQFSEYQQGETAKTAVFQTFKPLMASPIPGEQILTREGYSVSYNPTTLQPNYVAWLLTPERLTGNNQRSESFFEDKDLSDNERARLDDYYNSGFDRGHICPAGDNKWSKRAMTESFYLSNMCPQTHTLNHESWRILEETCREWVRYGGCNIYIISGPIFSDKTKRKANRRIPVPTQFFKALLCLDKGEEKGIAFIYDNNTTDQSMEEATVNIDEIERITSFDLFNTVQKNLQDKLERQSNLSVWKKKQYRNYSKKQNWR